jgi:hypothetical protein
VQLKAATAEVAELHEALKELGISLAPMAISLRMGQGAS